MRHTAATNNRAFILSLTSQFIDSSLHRRDSLVRALLLSGDAAIGLRQRGRLLEVGEALSGLPLPEDLRAIGAYYIGYAGAERGALDLKHAINHAPPRYRARAILSLAGLARNRGEDHWPQLYAEAVHQARAAQDVYTAIHAGKMLAIRRGIEGDHNRAIVDLESLFPLARLIAKQDPSTYLDWLNSLAVELQEVGKTNEASRAIQIVTASPLIAFNPEWQETATLIEQQQAAPLVLAVPALKAKPAVVAVPTVYGRIKINCGRKTRRVFSITCALTRAAIRAGPRAPPVVSSEK